MSVAVYVDPGMAVNALCVMDLGASAYTGGALALLPPGGCQDAVEEDGELTAHAGRGAARGGERALRAVQRAGRPALEAAQAATPPGEDLPGDIAGMLAAFNRIDLAIEVPGYGKGGISLVVP